MNGVMLRCIGFGKVEFDHALPQVERHFVRGLPGLLKGRFVFVVRQEALRRQREELGLRDGGEKFAKSSSLLSPKQKEPHENNKALGERYHTLKLLIPITDRPLAPAFFRGPVLYIAKSCCRWAK
jgi:hypothetical protein